MAELDTIALYNPTKEDFSHRFNGEMYTIPAQGRKEWPQFLALHMARHFSDVLMESVLDKLKNSKEAKEGNPYHPQVGQLMLYDNPTRRIALYKILKSKENVERVINEFPFKGFIGTMEEYDKFVATYEKKEESASSGE